MKLTHDEAFRTIDRFTDFVYAQINSDVDIQRTANLFAVHIRKRGRIDEDDDVEAPPVSLDDVLQLESLERLAAAEDWLPEDGYDDPD
jgi:hypothetical protein